LLRLAVVVHRQRQPIGPMPLGYAAQGPQGVLQPGAEASEVLPETKRDVLPVRIGQHEVIHQVRQRHPRDGHLQIIHDGEVRSRQATRRVFLCEEHFFARAVQGLPLPDTPLEGAPL
jgi:hypothetical protein